MISFTGSGSGPVVAGFGLSGVYAARSHDKCLVE